MKVYVVYEEYCDGWKNFYGVYSTEEKANIVKEIMGCDVDEFDLDEFKDLDYYKGISEEHKKRIKELEIK